MKELNLKVNFNNRLKTTINLTKKLRLKRMKTFLKQKFNIKEKFYLKCNKRILRRQDVFSPKFYKNNSEIQIIPIKNRNRACMLYSNYKILRTVATFFRYFLKIDIQHFDNILNTIKYSNPFLFSFILTKKNYFLKMIFSKQKKFNIDNLTKNDNIKNFFNSFEKIFFNKAKSFNLKNYMEKKISTENSGNNSSCYYNENNSKSSNLSKNSNNINNNSSNQSNFDDCKIQKCLNFNVINGKYEFFEANLENEKINNFVMIEL